MNLSFGERPVCLPVRTTSGPSAATIPSPARMRVLVQLRGGQVGDDGAADARRLGATARGVVVSVTMLLARPAQGDPARSVEWLPTGRA